MNFININLPEQPPKILNVAHISSMELWLDEAGQPKGCIIRMSTVAAREDLQAPVKHVTSAKLGDLLQKMMQAGAKLIP